jgi:hypothetical protein
MTSRSYPAEHIASRIFVVRGHKVLLDSDLASLSSVPTKRLVQSVKRNVARFPDDFVFQLTDQELASLRSQIVTSNSVRAGRGGRRWAYYAFTEQGVAMLSSVLRSTRAVAANIAIMRAFVRLREMVRTNMELSRKLEELELRITGHDDAIKSIVRAIRELAAPPQATPKHKIGFV